MFGHLVGTPLVGGSTGLRKWWINYLNDVWTSKKIVHVESRRWRAKGRKRERETGEEIRGSAGARLDDRPRSSHFYGCVDCIPGVVVVIYLHQRSLLRSTCDIVLATFLVPFLTAIH